MKLQGFLITEHEASQLSTYGGIAKYYAWPLTDCRNNSAQLLAKEQLAYWLDNPGNNLMLVENISLIERYVRECYYENIQTRVFFLTTEELDNVVTNDLQIGSCCMKFLGWDYLASIDASYLFDDGETLFDMQLSPLTQIRQRMTPYGLFGSKLDAISYADIRKKIAVDEQFELLGDEYIVAVYSC